jgi:hypothetical protein
MLGLQESIEWWVLKARYKKNLFACLYENQALVDFLDQSSIFAQIDAFVWCWDLLEVCEVVSNSPVRCRGGTKEPILLCGLKGPEIVKVSVRWNCVCVISQLWNIRMHILDVATRWHDDYNNLLNVKDLRLWCKISSILPWEFLQSRRGWITSLSILPSERPWKRIVEKKIMSWPCSWMNSICQEIPFESNRRTPDIQRIYPVRNFHIFLYFFRKNVEVVTGQKSECRIKLRLRRAHENAIPKTPHVSLSRCMCNP